MESGTRSYCTSDKMLNSVAVVGQEFPGSTSHPPEVLWKGRVRQQGPEPSRLQRLCERVCESCCQWFLFSFGHRTVRVYKKHVAA